MELRGDTAVRKKRTELTITTTRLTQFPTEWVTGDTRCNIMYETCTTKSYQHFPRINQSFIFKFSIRTL